ncbi:MAG: hypothetical protein R2848_16930 [Thermomicrobiales bacterium]
MPGPNIEQLEATRLMPFQRALTFYLAAVAVYVTLTLLADLIKRYRLTIVNLGVAGILLTLLCISLSTALLFRKATAPSIRS